MKASGKRLGSVWDLARTRLGTCWVQAEYMLATGWVQAGISCDLRFFDGICECFIALWQCLLVTRVESPVLRPDQVWEFDNEATK